MAKTQAIVGLVLCLSNFVLTQDWVTPSSNSQCNTPLGMKGQCISIVQCSPLLKLLQNRPISQQTIDLLKKSQCGFTGGEQPNVCCPEAAPITAMPDPDGPAPPDVSSHVNMRLLPHSTCGALLEDRIVRGNKTGLFEFPWMALLAYRARGGPVTFRCGGSLISDRYVLTAAHCLVAPGFQLVGVRLGEHNLDTEMDCEVQEDGVEICADPVQDRTIDATIIHPEYDRTKNYNDIALIRLSSPANLSTESVRPVCLPITNALQTLELRGKAGVVSGWGYTENRTRSPDLLKVDLPILGQDECVNAYSKLRVKIIPKQFCAGGSEAQGRDSCGGDSGGPLKVPGIYRGSTRVVQHGVVSFGPVNCGGDGVPPGVYTRVSHYMDWILDNLQA